MKKIFLLLLLLSINANAAQLYVVGDLSGKNNVAIEVKHQFFYSGYLNQKICMPFALKIHIDTSKIKGHFINFTVMKGNHIKINQDFVLNTNNAHNILIEYDGVKAKLEPDTKPPKENIFCAVFNRITRP